LETATVITNETFQSMTLTAVAGNEHRTAIERIETLGTRIIEPDSGIAASFSAIYGIGMMAATQGDLTIIIPANAFTTTADNQSVHGKAGLPKPERCDHNAGEHADNTMEGGRHPGQPRTRHPLNRAEVIGQIVERAAKRISQRRRDANESNDAVTRAATMERRAREQSRQRNADGQKANQ
jgi:hypothetical protein